MTNEEKAEEIAIKICGNPSENDTTGEYPCSEEAALEMAEWKDRQFREHLEKKRKKYTMALSLALQKDSIQEAVVYDKIQCLLLEIFNELFKEE